ncbi:MAG TPA: amidohydrolase family protein [Candidatus Limnocylindrales bacterium]|jgi:imidazolonepropionase-like amidohydrolase|nr:amidohydrolase family protein [Candidatus Limnocylindrales bacterium]
MNRTYYLLVLLAAFLCFNCVPASALQAKEDGDGIIVLHAGHMLDVKTGQLLNNPTLVIEGGKITKVGAPTWGNRPAHVTEINLPNATLLPGLIDVHTHITYDPQFGYQQLGISIPKEALIGAKNARVTLEAGFTTVRNVGASGYTDVALRDAINEGMVPGPRMIVSGPALSITGGHCDDNLLPFEYHHAAEGVADGVEAVQHKVRETIKYGADVIKVCATGGVLSKGDDPRASQFTLEEMKAIVADAHRLGRRVAAHAHGAQGIAWASEAGVDSIEHGSYIDDNGIKVMKEHGTYLVPTQYLMDWMRENATRIGLPAMFAGKMKEVTAASRENVKQAMQAGVKIAFGTDAAVYPHGLNAHEFAVYVQMGLTPIQAIQTATVNAADLLGWSDRIGVLEAGKFADIIAVNGDPIKDVTLLQSPVFVMKNGTVYKKTAQ